MCTHFQWYVAPKTRLSKGMGNDVRCAADVTRTTGVSQVDPEARIIQVVETCAGIGADALWV